MTQTRGAIVALAGALAFAFVATASALDRYSEHEPSAARLVPGPFKVHAARVESLNRLALDEPRQALPDARLAVSRDPVDARSLSILAVSRSAVGDTGGADQAFRAAALLGWRDVLTQLYWFRANLLRGETEAAALRLDAILRARSDFEMVQMMLGDLEMTDKGRAALARRLQANPVWTHAYLTAANASEDALLARARFLAAPDTGISSLGCQTTRPLIDQLANRGYRAEAESVARRHCPRLVGDGLVADPSFAGFAEGQSSPFGWRRHGVGDVRVSADENGVELANRASVTRLVLSQPVAVQPGEYVLRGKVSGVAPDTLLATVGCGTPDRPAGRDRGRLDEGGAILTVRSCPNPIVGLWLRPGKAAVRLSSVSLERRQP